MTTGRRSRRGGYGFTVWMLALTGFALQGTATSTADLTDLLVSKGVITAEEAAALDMETTEATSLTDLLVSKGVITREEASALPGGMETSRMARIDRYEAPSPNTSAGVTGRVPPVPPSVTSKFALSIYGYAKLDAVFESRRTNAGDLAFFVLPESAQGDDDAFYLTAKQTRLGLRVAAPPVQGWATSGRVEIDFFGSASENAANPRMRLAYMELENDVWTVLAGQAYDTWNLVLPSMSNFSAGGKQGALWSRRPQLRVARAWQLDEGGSLTAAFAAARNIGLADVDALGDSLDGGEDSGQPIWQWALKYTRDVDHGTAKFALGGHYGREEIEPVLGEEDFVTSLLIFSFDWPLTSRLGISGSLWTGENLSSFQGGIGQGISLARRTEVATSGGWLQAAWKLNTDMIFNLGYGLDDPKDSDLVTGNRGKNATLWTNLKWTFLPATTWVLEYQYLDTAYIDRPDASANRFQSSLIYNF